MSEKAKKPLHRGHNEGNIRQRTDGRWEVRLSVGIDLGSDFIGEVCSQILHGFQNCTVQFFFRDGR